MLISASVIRDAHTDDHHRGLARANARRLVQEHGATHECNEWLHDGACELCDVVYMPLRVGDVVDVARACGNNAPHSVAVVVQIYDREPQGSDRSGATLLFRNGFADGFSPADLTVFGVTFLYHHAALASYAFESIMRLDADRRAGRFVAVWR
jgi:hypothetical protein